MLTQEAPPTLDTHKQHWSPDMSWHATIFPKVLIIEDDVDVHLGWAVFLRHHGYHVLSAVNGRQGMEYIESEQPDIVLLDLGLPGMHGFRILYEMRLRGLASRVVVITASSSEETDLRAQYEGADVVLAKPVNLHSLVPVIDELLD